VYCGDDHNIDIDDDNHDHDIDIDDDNHDHDIDAVISSAYLSIHPSSVFRF
jgi:hypothetical protein